MSEFEKGVEKLTTVHKQSVEELQQQIDLLLKIQENEKKKWISESEIEKIRNEE